MICLDSSFVIDYWQGEEYTKGFLVEMEDDFGIPTVALYELYVGALLSDSTGETIGSVVDDLDWAEPLGFDETAARTAATIDESLLDRGERINAMDVLIAATARAHDATLIATDSHFERVPELELRNPQGR